MPYYKTQEAIITYHVTSNNYCIYSVYYYYEYTYIVWDCIRSCVYFLLSYTLSSSVWEVRTYVYST